VLSELHRPQPHSGVRRAVKQTAGEDLFISVITTGEIAKGIALLKDSSKEARPPLQVLGNRIFATEVAEHVAATANQFHPQSPPPVHDIAKMQ
jgi:predicted nucleic acid-binding protein